MSPSKSFLPHAHFAHLAAQAVLLTAESVQGTGEVQKPCDEPKSCRLRCSQVAATERSGLYCLPWEVVKRVWAGVRPLRGNYSIHFLMRHGVIFWVMSWPRINPPDLGIQKLPRTDSPDSVVGHQEQADTWSQVQVFPSLSIGSWVASLNPHVFQEKIAEKPTGDHHPHERGRTEHLGSPCDTWALAKTSPFDQDWSPSMSLHLDVLNIPEPAIWPNFRAQMLAKNTNREPQSTGCYHKVSALEPSTNSKPQSGAGMIFLMLHAVDKLIEVKTRFPTKSGVSQTCWTPQSWESKLFSVQLSGLMIFDITLGVFSPKTGQFGDVGCTVHVPHPTMHT